MNFRKLMVYFPFSKMDVHTAMPLPQWGFAPIVKKFSEKYHWEVLAISEFGDRQCLIETNSSKGM